MGAEPHAQRSDRPATRKDVARRAGVSSATVSYALNKTQKLPQETVDRVLRAASELGYRPNFTARSLVTRETRQIAIVLNNLANPIYADLIRGFEDEAIARGYFVAICTGYKNIDDYFDSFAARRVDGLFIEALPFKYHLEKLKELVDAGIRVVVFGNTSLDSRLVSHIETDYLDAMSQAVEYLRGLGHRDIAYLSGLSRRHTFDRRVDGYLAAMKTAGSSSPDRLLIASKVDTNTDVCDGEALATRLVRSGKRFTAAICTNDLMAVGALRAFRSAGLRVPADVSVIGIDNASVCEITDPTISTMAVPYTSVGSHALQMLYNDMTKGLKSYLKNRATLIERRSTGPAPDRPT